MDMWPGAWTLREDVENWTLEDVENWWKTLGPNAVNFIDVVQDNMIDGEKLLTLKKADFERMGMQSWLVGMFTDWVRDLKYDSADPVSRQELRTLICKNTKLTRSLSELISEFVRDDPENWDTSQLSSYLKARGMKKTAKQIRKQKISPANIEILIHDMNIPERGRVELANLYPEKTVYSRKHPHPLSWYAIIKSNVLWWVVLMIAFCAIAIVMFVRGGNSNSLALTIVGIILILSMLFVLAGCAFASWFWKHPAFSCMHAS